VSRDSMRGSEAAMGMGVNKSRSRSLAFEDAYFQIHLYTRVAMIPYTHFTTNQIPPTNTAH